MQEFSHLLLLFSEMLEYPPLTVGESVSEGMGMLSHSHPSSSEELAGFHRWLKKDRITHVEETYTCTFDLQGVCCPYVGHHLFGDNYRRSWFMAQLNHSYLERNFSSGNELPDHISVILRFLALNIRDEFSSVLWEEGLFPSVEKMVGTFGADDGHPYGKVLKSLFLLLQDDTDHRVNSPIGTETGGSGNA